MNTMANLGISETALDQAIQRAADYVFEVQRPDGSWSDFVPSSPSATGSALILLIKHDRERFAPIIDEGTRWLTDTQLVDGSWGYAAATPDDPHPFGRTYAPGSGPDRDATCAAIAALHLADPQRNATAIRKGMAWLNGPGGGIPAMLAQLASHGIPHLIAAGFIGDEFKKRYPIELVLLPQRLRRKVSFLFPVVLGMGLLQSRTRRYGPLRRILNRIAEPRALDWLYELQRFDGFQGALESSTLIAGPVATALIDAGFARTDPRARVIVECSVEFFARTVRPGGCWSIEPDLECSATELMTLGLQEAGYAADERLTRTQQWLRGAQLEESFFATGAPGGGWPWRSPDGWPNSDDTSFSSTALANWGFSTADHQLRKGIDWLLAMQHSSGAWSCFVRNSRLAFDEACPVYTAHALIALHATGHGLAHPAVAKALTWLREVQHPDGSVRSVWYRKMTAGTAIVLDAYGRYGLTGRPESQRCRDWLLRKQNPDGGWGDGLGASSTVEESAWALCGLLSADPRPTEATARAAAWLLDAQQDYGGWRPDAVGYYFQDLTYSSDHLANGIAIKALARFRRALSS